MAASPYLNYSWQSKVTKVGRVIYLDAIIVDGKENKTQQLHQHRGNRFKALSIGDASSTDNETEHYIINKAKLNSHRLVIASQVAACQVRLSVYFCFCSEPFMLAFICSVVSLSASLFLSPVSLIIPHRTWKLSL